MKYRPFEKFNLFVLAFLLYYGLRIVFQLPEYLAVSLPLLTIILLHNQITLLIRSFLSRLAPTKFRLAQHRLLQFENKLNESLSYHQMLREYYNFLSKFLVKPEWVLYVVDENVFFLSQVQLPDENAILPNEIRFDRDKKFAAVIDLQKTETPFDPAPFLSHELSRIVPIQGKQEVFALLFTRPENLFYLHNNSLAALANKILTKSGQLLEHTALYLDLVQRNLQIKKLFEISNQLLSSPNTEAILDFILDALGDVFSFDCAVIFLFDPDTKELHRKVSKGYAANLDLTLKLGQGACGWVAENREVSVLPDVAKAEHYYALRPETRSQLTLPLEIHDELLGVLCLESNELGYFTEDIIDLTKIFASQAALALSNAKQLEIAIEKRSLESELIKAANVQSVLLPKNLPYYKELNIAFSHLPSKIVSGDLFDLVQLDTNQLGVIIGDISGKGASAAIMMSLVLAGFRAFKKSDLAVCEVIARLNNLLEESVSGDRFATLFYALISIPDQQLVFTNAGHDPPILVRENGEIEELSGGGIVIGFLPNQPYTQHTVGFKPGDLLFCYTDGLTESMNNKGEEFGKDRLKQLIAENSELNPYKLKNVILEKILKFTGRDNANDDDQTMVIIKYLATPVAK